MQRGKIYNKGRATQIRDFSGLRFGKITPTDIDAVIDFRDKLFILIEAKYRDAKMPSGQCLALERLSGAIQDSGRNSVILIVRHDSPPDQAIDFAESEVSKYKYGRKEWRHPKSPITCRAAIEILLKNEKIHL